MFFAKNQAGELIDLTRIKRDEVKQLKKMNWFCCDCQEPVILKAGRIKQMHFAHGKDSECQSFSEGETREHLAGKTLLYQNCCHHQIQVELEAYLPKLKQRPDVLVDQKLALEFQCSPLSFERLKERTDNYQKHGYEVLWILGRELFSFGKKGPLSKGQQQFIQFSNCLGYYSFGLRVETSELVLTYGMYLNEGRLTSSLRFFSLENQSLFEIFAAIKLIRHSRVVPRSLYEVTKAQRLMWQRSLYNRRVPEMLLQEYFYCQHENLLQLPLYFHCLSLSDLFLGEVELILRWELVQQIKQEKSMSREELQRYISEKQVSEELSDIQTLFPIKKVISYRLRLYVQRLIEFDFVQVKAQYYYWNDKRCDSDAWLEHELRKITEEIQIPYRIKLFRLQ